MGFWNRLFGQKAAVEPHVRSSTTQNDAESHVRIGTALRNKGDIKTAIEEYRKAIQLKPDYAEAHSKLGAALCDSGDQNAGALECREAIRLKPDDFAATYHLGNALYQKGDFSGAIAQYRAAIRLKPDLLEARNNLGNTLYRTRDLNAAIAEFRELIHLAPTFRDSHNNLANALYEKGDVQAAIAEYREAIRLNPNSADTRYNLANVLNETGAADDAIVEFQHAIKLMPNFPDAHLNLGNALAGKGELDGAIAEYREVLRLKPDELLARQNLEKAIALKDAAPVQRGQAKAAAVQAARATPPAPTQRASDSAVAGSNYGDLTSALDAGRQLFSEHRYSAAMDKAIAALDIDPKNGEALNLAGTILYLCSSAHSQDEIRPSVREDPLLDGLFSQCSRCHRCWPGNPALKGFRGQAMITNPLGGRCPKCQKVWCRECAPGEMYLSCPECRVALEIPKEPSGRKRGLGPAKRPELRLRQICIFKAPPKPRNASSYATMTLDALCPDAFHSAAEIFIHTGEEGTNEEAATQFAIARWMAKGIKVPFGTTFRESFMDADGGKGIMLTMYEPKQ
jgi:tetratricopeptide (TPR) repeat protein